MDRLLPLIQRIPLPSLPRIRVPNVSLSSIIVAALIALAGMSAVRYFDMPKEQDFPVRVASAQSALPTDFQQYASMPRSLEMHIANSGMTLLRGARVVAKDGDVLRVAMQWGSQDFIWNIVPSNGTKFLNASGEKIDGATIHVGDFVTVSGNLDSDKADPTINAQFIRSSWKGGGRVQL